MNFNPEPTQPRFFSNYLFMTKKRKRDSLGLVIYGSFLSISDASIAPTIAIAMIMPATAGRK